MKQCSHLLRILAGLSNSFLTGNVYMADTAPNHLVASFKQIEVTSSQQPHMLSRDNIIEMSSGHEKIQAKYQSIHVFLCGFSQNLANLTFLSEIVYLRFTSDDDIELPGVNLTYVDQKVSKDKHCMLPIFD